MANWKRAFGALFDVMLGGSGPPARTTKPAPRKPAGDPKAPPLRGKVILENPGRYNRDVVGEGHYQDALLELCGPYSREPRDLRFAAKLVPDPKNPYDENAIRVEIEGRHVGHLDRYDAERFVREIGRLGHAGETIVCGSRIWGGWRTNQHDERPYEVKLDFNWPLKLKA